MPGGDAGDAGAAIGAGLVVALWTAVDVIPGSTYGVHRLAARRTWDAHARVGPAPVHIRAGPTRACGTCAGRVSA
ncbi:hypothetical protein GCM10010233_18990 [Streptomyces pseudogriseolus]|nr:hypothetical protein GCM10010233_18990 [Streptomyces gancidicus]